MKIHTMEKKIEVLEHAFAEHAGAYYSINLTKNIVPGTMYQIIDGQEYSINEQIGMKENASFTEVVKYWSAQVPDDEKQLYFNTLNISNLLEHYAKGETHVKVRYWTKTALFDPMLAEQHIVMFEDEETEDILAITYVIDLTNEYKEKQYKKELEKSHVELEKALESANRANQAKSIFLNNMSHDIRTPMNAILGYTQLICERITDPEILHYQEMIDQSGKLLLSIINNVLDMARIESGQMELDEAYHHTGEVVNEACDVFEMEARKKNITMKHTLHVEHPDIICDKVKMREILTNIIGNAVKYTPPGGEIVISTVDFPCEEEGYVMVQTTVEDTGIGMSEEFLPHLFDSFARERTTTEGKVAGSGLGMAIVKSLVEMMKGTIQVESKLGKGSKFTITIPHKIAEPEQDKKKLSAESIKDIDFTGKHILLAEDNELNAEIATIILENIGVSVDHVEDGALCVERLEKAPAGMYDLILMDIQMPNMDGYSSTQNIRHLSDKEKSCIPIIAMTANAFVEDRKKAFEVGMNGYIAKPIDVDELKETLASVFDANEKEKIRG